MKYTKQIKELIDSVLRSYPNVTVAEFARLMR